MHELVSDWVLN